MADPTRYERGYSFAGFQANSPRAPLPGQNVDAELDNLGRSVNSTAEGLMDIRRSDGALRNGIVTNEALSPEVSAGVKPTVLWTTATQYSVGATISYQNALYRCVEQHISGVLADDIEAGLWVEFARFSPVFATTPEATGGTNETASMNSKNVKDSIVANGRFSLLTDMLPFPGYIARTVLEKLSEMVEVEDFGVVRGNSQALAAANDTAYDLALAAMELKGGGNIFQFGQYYSKSKIAEVPSSVHIWGSGVGEWEPIFSARPKTWFGTNVIMWGTGTKTLTFPGVTSMKNGGGHRPDPDNPGSFFKQFSAYNADATGTTPATLRQFSAAFAGKANAQGWGLHNFRIVNAIGSDGITDHSNQATSSLGSNWDFGVVIKDGEYCTIEGIQSVGYWREAGFAQMLSNTTNSRGERNQIRNCRFQGRVGILLRSPDRWFCTTPTTSSVQITWSEESYWPATGTFRGSDNVTYTYTGLARAGGSSEYLQFTGVTPNPTGIFQVRHASTGVANAEFQNVICTGLDHVSGVRASVLGLLDSKGIEGGGFPLRGFRFSNFKVHTEEAILAHFHDASQFDFLGTQWEGGGHIISSSVSTASPWASAQVGDTREFNFVADDGILDQDLRLFLRRGGFVESQMRPTSGLTNDHILRPGDAESSVRLQSFAGVDFLDAEIKTFTPAFRFVTVTSYTTQTGRYIRVGDYIYFEIYLDYTGLDTTDTSVLSITLGITGNLSYPVTGQILERTSTGINMNTLTRPYLDLSTEGHLALSHNRTARVAYNTASIFSASGIISIVGFYKAGS